MKNRCIITFEGLNINRFVNNLCRQNITILGLSRDGKQCILQVDATHSQKVVAQLKEKCYNILDIHYTGVSFGLQFAKARFVLIAAVLLCVILLGISSQICLRIETQGDFDDVAVRQALYDSGIGIGTPLVGFNPDAVENAVANKLKAMYAVVSRKGSVIYVNAVARKQIDIPIDMSKRRDVISTVNGIVTSVLCEQGNLLVKVGDAVKVGDVLIEGRRVFNDGESRDVYALGRITVRQSVQGSVEFNGYKTELQPTGNECVKTGVVLFGKEYVQGCPYDSFSVKSSYAYLQPLNLAIIYNTYCETRSVTVSCSLNDCLDELQKQAYDSALKECGFVPQDVEYTVTGNIVTATLSAQTYIQ